MRKARFKLKLFIALAIIVLVAAVFFLGAEKPNPLRYHPITVAPTIPKGAEVSYDFLNPAPFVGGKMWIHVLLNHSGRMYLYDLEEKKVLGEFTGGNPICFSADNKKLFCSQGERGKGTPPIYRFFGFLNRLTGDKAKFHVRTLDVERFWLLNLDNNSTQFVGDSYELSGFRSKVLPSPDRRFAFNTPSENGPHEIALYMLEEANLETPHLDGTSTGWLDNQDIVF